MGGGAVMTPYVCDACGADFEEPYRYTYKQNLDGEHGIETVLEYLCPYCGSDEIGEEET